MASQNIARLGVLLGLDMAQFTADMDKAVFATKRLEQQAQKSNERALKEALAIKQATEDYGKTLTKVEQIERAIAEGRYQGAQQSVLDNLRRQAQEYDRIAASAMKARQAQMAGAAGLTPQQQAQVGYQLTDIFTSLSGGQNPMMVLIQQGGQLRDVFGGVGNAIRAIVETVGPLRLAFAGVAAVVGTFAYAAYKGAEEMARLRDDLILTNNIAGLTQARFLELGETVANKVNVSIGNAREILGQLAASGKFTETSFEAVSGVIAKFAQLAGVSGKEAAQKLIPLLDGTSSSARQLNSQFNFLTLAQYKQIEALEKYGRIQESIKLQSDALNDTWSKQTRALGMLEQAWESLKNIVSKTWDAMLGIGREDPAKRLEELTKNIATLRLNIERDRGRIPEAALQNKEQMLQRLEEERKLIQRAEDLKAEDAKQRAKKQAEENKKIADRVASGGIEGEIQRKYELERAKIAVERAQLVKSLDERTQVEREYEEKVQDAVLKMREKNEREAFKIASHNAKMLQQEVLKLYAERGQKLREIEAKTYLEYKQQATKEQDEYLQYLANVENTVNQLNQAQSEAFIRRKDEVDLETKMLDFKKSNVFALEYQVNLQRNQLEIARQLAEVERDPRYGAAGEQGEQAKRDEIARIERMGKMKEALILYQEEMRKMAEMTDAVWGNMSRAIENFVRTGKLSFKDLARSIIQDLILIQLRTQMTTIFKSFIGNIFGGGGTNIGLGTGVKGFGSAYAEGGSPPVGRASLVGERGPELFVPNTAGTIIPNAALAGMGGVTNVTNNYIQAIDVQSFEQRLLGSSNTIWAANQYAQKSIPTGRGRT